jgi:hypothetical protein
VASLFINDTWSAGRMTINAGVRYDRYSGWLPEQQQLAATVGPASVDARTFPEVDMYTWNLFAPRVGVVYDLAGDGRTVLKATTGSTGTTRARRRRVRRTRTRRRSSRRSRGTTSTATAGGSRVSRAT